MQRLQKELATVRRQLKSAFDGQVRMEVSDHDNLDELELTFTIIPNDVSSGLD
eukprot:m.401704 g.401704  ORF g.401704 m.401704 type:complete len:53 (+) comp56446_c0_seq3:186-344(+)